MRIQQAGRLEQRKSLNNYLLLEASSGDTPYQILTAWAWINGVSVLWNNPIPSPPHTTPPNPTVPLLARVWVTGVSVCRCVCLFWAITGYLSRLATCSINSAELRIAQTGLLQQHLWTAVIAKFKMQHQQGQSPLSINTGPWLRSASNNKGNLVEADESKEDEAGEKVSF